MTEAKILLSQPAEHLVGSEAETRQYVNRERTLTYDTLAYDLLHWVFRSLHFPVRIAPSRRTNITLNWVYDEGGVFH
jgi:hypothetical protein